MNRVITLLFVILFVGNLGMAQENTSRLSKEDQQTAVDAMLDRANVALQANQFDKVQKNLSAAMEIATDSIIHAKAEVVEAKFFAFTGELDQALENVQRLKKIIPKDSDSYTELLLVEADIFIKKEKFLNADETLKSVKLNISSASNPGLAVQADYLRANLFLGTGNLDEAVTLYQEIVPDLRKQELYFLEAQAQYSLAQALFEQGNYERADATVDQALQNAESYGYTGIKMDGFYLKSTIAKGMGNFEQSLNYLNDYLAIKNSEETSGFGFESSANARVLLKQKDEEIKEFKAIIADQQSTLKGRGNYSILLFVLLTLLSLLTMSLFKNNKLRARSNQALEGKNSALIDERDRAQDAAKIKADFLSTITHELRTPMYAVTGLTHLLLETEPRHDQKEHLETLQSSGEYLLSLIDNILDFNKLEANKVELEQIPFDLKKRVEDITVSLENQAKEQMNSLSLEFDSSIPSRIKGDPVKISQILINLVGNAIKFTKNGNIWVRVNQVKQIEDRCLIHFEVEDNGKGISEEKQQDIFNNFTQEGSSTTREYGGTGLGLAIVKNLITLMGSEVQLDSKIGRGSIFSFDLWFELPDSNKFYEDKNLKIYDTTATEEEEYPEYRRPQRAKRIEPTAQEPATQPTEAEKQPEPEPVPEVQQPAELPVAASSEDQKKEIIGTKKPSPKDLIAKKILIVEDNKINQMITRKILEGKNFDCDIANNGIEALGKIKETEYDLVLMDIHMPGMDGKQCTREVRKFDRELPIIALTAVTLDESEKEFYEIGFDDIIPKPFKMNEFFEKIQKAFTNYQIY